MANVFPITSLSDKGRRTLRSTADLVDAKLISPAQEMAVAELSERYAIAITPDMAELISGTHGTRTDQAEQHDPIGLQFIPDPREQHILPQEYSDPIGDDKHSPLRALVHRYPDRVLLKPTNICAVYCRFCFRREMVGPDGDSITQHDVDLALDYIDNHTEIREVIFSGGDPLMLSARRLQPIMQRLHKMDHIRRIRFHSRVPVVAPDKISDEVIGVITGEKPVYIAIHANHAREFTAAAAAALERLATKKIVLLGQSVLLKGINNTVDDLADLCNAMLDHRIKPYYLHHPDLTAGTGHFRLDFEEGMALLDGLRQRVSGLAVPQYTLDIPGGFSKIAISRDTVQAIPNKKGHYRLRDVFGEYHYYSDILP